MAYGQLSRRGGSLRRVALGAVVATTLALVLAAGALAYPYTVRSGDTLFLIAQRTGVSLSALRQANNLWTDWIYPGQRLEIPAGSSGGSGSGSWTTYVVRSGDTLYLIAQRYGVSLSSLRQANNLWSDWIYPGQQLLIPSSASGGSGSPGGSTPPPSGGGGGSIGQPSWSDLDLLARLVTAEASGEPYEGQVAVAAVVLNRVKDPRFPNTIRAVIYQYDNGVPQFEPVYNGRINLPATATARQAAQEALNGWDPSWGATGFFNPGLTWDYWVRQWNVTRVIGNHVFFRF